MNRRAKSCVAAIPPGERFSPNSISPLLGLNVAALMMEAM
jgi:hypothetical protein